MTAKLMSRASLYKLTKRLPFFLPRTRTVFRSIFAIFSRNSGIQTFGLSFMAGHLISGYSLSGTTGSRQVQVSMRLGNLLFGWGAKATLSDTRIRAKRGRDGQEHRPRGRLVEAPFRRSQSFCEAVVRVARSSGV